MKTCEIHGTPLNGNGKCLPCTHPELSNNIQRCSWENDSQVPPFQGQCVLKHGHNGGHQYKSQSCETTKTLRFDNPLCQCKTYEGNLGPCIDFTEGANGRCVYCDHEKLCHDQLDSQLCSEVKVSSAGGSPHKVKNEPETMPIPNAKWVECLAAGRHSSFQLCEHCVKIINVIGPIDTGGLMKGEIYRTKDEEPARFFRLVKA